jgi:hypothetical protein
MDAPKCRLCGNRHWGGCRIVVIRQAPSELPLVSVESGEGWRVETRRLTIPAPEKPEPKKRAPRGTFDRAAYQREYMRRRRAAQKPQ